MATKVFISWSGELSNKLAEAVREWLPVVLQFVKLYFTPSDVEKGTKWESDVLFELNSSDIGIICLTKENLNKPWILFESGALSKNLEKARVCTLLFDVEPTDLKGPLTIFQNTRFKKVDFKKLVKTINIAGGEAKLEDSVFDEVFGMWWPKLEEKVSKILKEHKNVDEGDHRADRDLLEEILELTRYNTHSGRAEVEHSPQIVIDLLEGILRLTRALNERSYNRARRFCYRLERPFSSLCAQLNLPDHYGKFQRLLQEGVSKRPSTKEVASDDDTDKPQRSNSLKIF